MIGVNFPIFKTKLGSAAGRFNLNDPEERKKYFALKARPEIEKLRRYLEKNTFVAFLLGKKNSGKGTYTKLFMEAVGSRNVGHVSVGDIVRDVHASLEHKEYRDALLEFLKKNYRGFHSVEETVSLIEGRDTTSLVSTEIIVALLKYEISRRPRQAIFIDGFPRGLDQISYSLFLKELLGYRDDPDFLVFIDVPESAIDARIRSRLICPKCKNPRSLRLAPTKYIGYDKEKKTFYLMCDNPECGKARMVPKEGDELGIEPIRARLEVDDQVFKRLLELHGIPKAYLRNAVPVSKAKEFVDDYEITPGYQYEFDEETGQVRTIETPWVIADENGAESYSLLPAPVAVSLIKQTTEVLGL